MLDREYKLEGLKTTRAIYRAVSELHNELKDKGVSADSSHTYDPKKDIVLDKLEEEVKGKENSVKFIVTIHQYNKGVKKVQLSRNEFFKENWNFVRLGRFDKQDLETITNLLKKIKEKI
jgi:hypothetical protein